MEFIDIDDDIELSIDDAEYGEIYEFKTNDLVPDIFHGMKVSNIDGDNDIVIDLDKNIYYEDIEHYIPIKKIKYKLVVQK